MFAPNCHFKLFDSWFEKIMTYFISIIHTHSALISASDVFAFTCRLSSVIRLSSRLHKINTVLYYSEQKYIFILSYVKKSAMRTNRMSQWVTHLSLDHQIVCLFELSNSSHWNNILCAILTIFSAILTVLGHIIFNILCVPILTKGEHI